MDYWELYLSPNELGEKDKVIDMIDFFYIVILLATPFLAIIYLLLWLYTSKYKQLVAGLLSIVVGWFFGGKVLTSVYLFNDNVFLISLLHSISGAGSAVLVIGGLQGYLAGNNFSGSAVSLGLLLPVMIVLPHIF